MCILFAISKFLHISFHLPTCQLTCHSWDPPVLALRNMYMFCFCKAEVSLNHQFHLKGLSTSCEDPYMTKYFCNLMFSNG